MRISDWSSDVCSSDLNLPICIVYDLMCGAKWATALARRNADLWPNTLPRTLKVTRSLEFSPKRRMRFAWRDHPAKEMWLLFLPMTILERPSALIFIAHKIGRESCGIRVGKYGETSGAEEY